MLGTQARKCLHLSLMRFLRCVYVQDLLSALAICGCSYTPPSPRNDSGDLVFSDPFAACASFCCQRMQNFTGVIIDMGTSTTRISPLLSGLALSGIALELPIGGIDLDRVVKDDLDSTANRKNKPTAAGCLEKSTRGKKRKPELALRPRKVPKPSAIQCKGEKHPGEQEAVRTLGRNPDSVSLAAPLSLPSSSLPRPERASPRCRGPLSPAHLSEGTEDSGWETRVTRKQPAAVVHAESETDQQETTDEEGEEQESTRQLEVLLVRQRKPKTAIRCLFKGGCLPSLTRFISFCTRH